MTFFAFSGDNLLKQQATSIDSEKSSNVQNSIQQNNSSTSKQQDPLPINSIDIGNLLDGLKDIDDENRFRNHFQPDASFGFPSTFKHGYNRPLYQFLSYSKALDAVFVSRANYLQVNAKAKPAHSQLVLKFRTKLMKKQVVITYLRIM